ncbi:helix-turn-helix transcriptional regulator [Agriterribacter sp.]|uniref:helix-turn-helix domain-containing protein n=1 Tax=Agriterribacter sp. TaxID=2821509 RepID=UPI002C0FB30B|nr:helix-turn-helix transcriptional regulator [Agriterribacter sp.]HRP58418.1 helix-turn-helix transcriptional regulator [Agriterribacter sp.]
MKLIIKNMVCPRCISSVEQMLKNNNLPARYIRLGEVELTKDPGKSKLEQFSADLKKNGFELLDDQKMQQIEKIKNLLIGKVQEGSVEDHFSISKFLGKKIFKDYSALSKLFSEVEGITIEQFFILQKIEKVKEWLMYNELSLSQIAFNLGYSSTQHLSNQFKKLTGMTPTRFKQLGAPHRKAIDAIHK